MPDARIVNVTVDRPDAREREAGAVPHATMLIDRGLRSEKLDVVRLSRADLVGLIAAASSTLAVLEREEASKR
jgi:hypothetical protein